MRGRIPEIDIEFTLRVLYRPSILGSIFTKLGSIGAYIGDVTTVEIGKTYALRKILISVHDQEHLKEVLKTLNAHDATEVITHTDLVFDRHKDGKIHTTRTKDISSLAELRYIYTPGVARVCSAIHKDAQKIREYTIIGNHVGIFTNGTRVLGLGDIGPEASMPVMEGKAVIYDQFVGVSATPILVNTKNPEEFVQTVMNIAPSFGAIHLEDIRVPDCFYIESELKKRLQKPVMHNDQHGTGTVTLAAVMSILRIIGKKPKDEFYVTQVGLGAAGFGIASLLHDYGAKIIGVDPDPVAQKRFEDYGGEIDDLESAFKRANIVISTTGVIGAIRPTMVRKGQVILALSNPHPEMTPEEALAAGAAFAADGKTINNALAYPALFKAALAANTNEISSKMKIKAAEVISNHADKNELVPSPLHPGIHNEIVKAVLKECS